MLKEAIEYLLSNRQPLEVSNIYRQLCRSLGQNPIEEPEHRKSRQQSHESLFERNHRHDRERRYLHQLVARQIQTQIPNPPTTLTVYNHSFGGLVKCGIGKLVIKDGIFFNYRVDLNNQSCLVAPYKCKEIVDLFGIDINAYLTDMRSIRWS